MGKKSRKAQKPAPKNIPGWHDKLPLATTENVSKLPQVDHGWLCAVFGNDSTAKVLAIMDITNQTRGEGSVGRVMNLGPLPDLSYTHSGDDIVSAILATMMGPAQPTQRDIAEYYVPRRPAWLLLQPELESVLDAVRTKLGEVDIVVKLNTPEALAAQDDDDNEGGGGASDAAAEDASGRLATWEIGLTIGATVDNVKDLPKVNDDEEEEEVWKATMNMIEDKDKGTKECFLAVEHVTSDQSHYPLGFGPCPAATVNPDGMVRCLFATMLSPKDGDSNKKNSGEGEDGGPSGYGTARRPSRVILDKALEPWLEHVQTKLSLVDVQVELAS